MIIVVRLHPRSDLSKLWDYVENSIIKEDATQYMTPLYATQAEGMMGVAVVFDVDEPDNIADFLVENLAKCQECHHSSTISLMKPIFFPIPKKRPSTIYRFVIRIYTHPRHYKTIYDFLLNYDYPSNLFPVYVSYSLGDEDIVMNIATDSQDTLNKFIKEKVRQLEGAQSVYVYPVVKAKRFASLEKLIEKQQKYLTEKAKKIPEKDIDKKFDWVEDFEEYAMLTGAFRRDL
jgi:hypothetical protein